MDDKTAAYILYKEGVAQGDIAKLLDRSEVTISRWKKRERWDERSADEMMAMQTIHDSITDLVRYQLQTLNRIKEEYVDSNQPRLISKGDIDGVRDLYNMIKSQETDWTTQVRIVRHINNYLKSNAPDLAPKVAPLLNQFLSEQRGGEKR